MADDTNTVTRARATCPEWDDISQPIPERREGKVLYVMSLMAASRWETGKSGPRLAAAWNISQGYIDQIAAEASRRTKENAPVVRARLAMACEKAIRVVEDELDPPTGGKCPECGRSDLDAVRALPPLVDKYDGLFREKGGITINNTVIQSLTVDQIRSAPAVRELLGALADTGRPLLEAIAARRPWAELDALARAHAGAMGLEADRDVVEMLPAFAGEADGVEES